MSKIIETVTNYVAETNQPIYAFSAISDKFGQETIKFVPGNRSQNTYSVSKAFTVTAIGMAVDKGLITIEDKITDILSDYIPEGIDSRWYGVSVKDALGHKLGLPHGFLDIDVAPAGAFGTDYLGFMLKAGFEKDPGTEYEYTDAAYYLLSRIAEKALGKPIDDYLWETLFGPMNFYEAAWSHCPQGHPMGATGLYIAAEDMVKLGELYRKNGVWNGQRIISEEWVKTVLTAPFELRPRSATHSYGKGGMKGQDLCVFPEKGLSVAWTAYSYKDKDTLLQLLYECDF